MSTPSMSCRIPVALLALVIVACTHFTGSSDDIRAGPAAARDTTQAGSP